MRKILFILSILIGILPAVAQMREEPISWRATVRMTSETQGTVMLRANIEPGWHLYSVNLPDGGPKPTTFSFKGSEGVKFDGPVHMKTKTIEELDPQFGLKLAFFEETALFTRDFTLEPSSDDAKVVVKVEFMGCNNQTCLPPRTVTLTVDKNQFRKKK